MRTVGLVLIALLCAACVKHMQLTAGGSSVRLLMKSEPVTGCQELNGVSTGNDWLRSVDDVRMYLRNETATAGGNLVVVDVLEKEENLYKGSGRAFRCQN